MYIDLIPNRINCNNLTAAEWACLNRLETFQSEWIVPTREDKVQIFGLLALVDIRRGYEEKNEGRSYQFGVGQVRINEHGLKALQYRRDGKVYEIGEPTSLDELIEILNADGLDA